ncbi:MAG: ParB N-terminal domain-containing protein [Desulfobacterales bacterium]|nr:ParB N-terminal domain-containing protein [Desulfobacterales bacterium]
MRSKFKDTGAIPVSEILLDQNNYRLGPLDSQMDCFTIMFEEFGQKIIKLAGHIAQYGLSPKPVVVSKDDDGRWVVQDGNRRLTALKLLNNPAEAPKKYQHTFQILKNNAIPGIIPDKINCLTADKATIVEYRKLEHMGEQGGIGQVPWDPRAQGNLQIDIDGRPPYPLARAVCEYLEQKGISEARSVPITNIQRLLQDSEVSKQLGIVWDGQELKFAAKEDEVFNILKEIIIDFTINEKTVDDIYHPSDRKKYINELFEVRGFKEPTPLPKIIAPTLNEQVNEQNEEIRYTARARPPWDRKRVITRYGGLPVSSKETKLQTVLAELAKGIDVREATIASGVLIRLVLERSVESYIKKNSVSYNSDKLHHRITKVAEEMKVRGVINKKQFEQLKKMSQSENLISAHTLNAWVHNPDYIPTPRDVCTFWDNIYFFLVKCWK